MRKWAEEKKVKHGEVEKGRDGGERGRKSRRENKGDLMSCGGDGGRAGVCGMPPPASGPVNSLGLGWCCTGVW